ncbi:MAG: type II CRISPR RNA-guided endonuclease Cas9 [Sphingomonadaceae bacterium]
MLRLGLDVGTNSVGWCLMRYDPQNAPAGEEIVDIGVRIFPDGRDPSGTSLAVDRREARAARRRRDRYLRRRSAFLAALVEHKLMPVDTDEAKLVAERDPYALRKRALDEKLEPYEIGRALFHLNQRRGFKSNRKAERKQGDETGKIAKGAEKLDAAMAEAKARTLGEFLAGRDEKRVRMGGEAQDYDFYPQRRHVEEEFEAIWDAQAAQHPELLTETARAALHRILFFQRPLKEQPVGVCTFVTAEKRLPKAHPLFQQRRLHEEVNQLEITTPGEPQCKLTKDQRDTLILYLRTRKSAAYDSLAKKLKLDPGQSFNKASETRTKMLGDEVYATMANKKLFGNRWAHFSVEEQWAIVERLMEEEDPEALHAFLREQYGLDDAQIEAAEKAARSLPEGYGRLGATATRLILDELEKDVITYDKTVKPAGALDPRLKHHSDFRTGEILPKLPYYGELLTREIPPGTLDPSDPEEKRWGKITNPTVHIGLRQLEKLVNDIIKIHGRPDQIVVELARELKLNEKQKEAHNKRIRETTAAAERRSEKLRDLGQHDSGANRMLLRMWEELNPKNPLDRRCPYCGEQIGAEALFNGSADIDHILPYSRTLDDSVSNKVVAHRNCNRQKGHRTPWEAWGETERWDAIAEQVARLHKGKQWRFGPDAMARVEKDGGFIARQLTDTQYLSRMARTYLSSLYADKSEGSVYVIPGRMTAMLRRLWGLNSLLPDHNFVENEHSNAPKNRLDHRHHAIDAAVVAVTTRSLLMKIARAAGRAEEKDLEKQFDGLPEPWDGFRDELGEKLWRVIVSHKPDHGLKSRDKLPHVTAGQLHNETAYGLTGKMAADGKTPIVVHRVPLTSLKPGDITDPDRIPDEALREALLFATRGERGETLTGKAFEQALLRFQKKGWKQDKNGKPLFQGIRRVRVHEPLNVIPIRRSNGQVYKAYKGDSNARFDVWRLPNGKWVTKWKNRSGQDQSSVISTFDAHQHAHLPPKPHPAAKKVLSLHQNDLIAMEADGETKIYVVQQIWTDGRVVLVGHRDGGDFVKRAKNTDDPFEFVRCSASTLKKRKARQVRVDRLGRVFDPGPRE